jgi:hypothetical protein
MHWEVDRAEKSGDHAKADSLREQAAASARVAEQAAAAAAAKAAAANTERLRSKSARAAAHAAAEQQASEDRAALLDHKGGELGLSVDATGLRGVGGVGLPHSHNSRGRKVGG